MLLFLNNSCVSLRFIKILARKPETLVEGGIASKHDVVAAFLCAADKVYLLLLKALHILTDKS
jgi:hypothetical protein